MKHPRRGEAATPSRGQHLRPGKAGSAVFLAMLLQACAVTQDPARGPVVDMPARWDATATTAEAPALTTAWWQGFGSPALVQLLDEAQAGSADLRIAIERMRQADIALQQAGIARLPSVGGNLSTSTGRSDAAGTPSTSRESTSAGLSVSYELDLWGRIAAGV